MMQPILVADDDRGDLDLVQLLFRLSNLRNPIQTACNGDQVIDYLSGRGIYADRVKYPYPVLCLLDLRMPRRSGFEVLEWLERHSEQTVQIILPTVLRSSSLRMAGARADDYPALEKPFTLMKFQNLIAEHHALHIECQSDDYFLARKPARTMPVNNGLAASTNLCAASL